LASFLELAARVYEQFGRHAKLLRDIDQVRLVRLEKADQPGKEIGVPRAGAELVRPNSSQVEEALGPAAVAERCRERRESERMRIIMRFALHGLRWCVKA
jgi:hypothetical protein